MLDRQLRPPNEHVGVQRAELAFTAYVKRVNAVLCERREWPCTLVVLFHQGHKRPFDGVVRHLAIQRLDNLAKLLRHNADFSFALQIFEIAILEVAPTRVVFRMAYTVRVDAPRVHVEK